MAPALVKHCAAKERNSIGKKIFNLDCISDIVFKQRIGKHSVFQKEVLMEDNSGMLDRIDLQLINNMPFTAVADDKADSKIVSNSQSFYVKNQDSFTDQIKKEIETETTEKKHDSDLNHGKTRNIPAPENYIQRKYVQNAIYKKKDSVENKLFNVDLNLSTLNKRLWAFQSKVFSSKIAKNSLHRSTICETEKVIDIVDDTSKKSHSRYNSTHNTPHHPNNFLKSKVGCWDITGQKQKRIQGYDALIIEKTEESLSEIECENKLKLTSKFRKKTDDPPPSSLDLYKWKQKRAEVGSKCSWLNLNISELDKKIERINTFHERLKTNRIKSKSLSVATSSCGSNSSNISHTTESLGDCSRVQPVATSYRHKYLTLNNNKDENKCLDERNSHVLSAQELDHSHHPVLSFRNETSLALLLEETLRNEHINTKVTITKSTKKKKKPKQNGTAVSTGTLLSKTNETHSSSRSRNHRVIGNDGDVHRKRHHPVASSSTRTRKVRKLSDSVSCDSPKPLTPTHEMASPSTITQNLKSHGFFPAISQKKKTSSGDFDINNIVIPYSMASSTRVERIQYKEIPTPGWRSIWNEIGLANGYDDWECTDDELYLERHDRCEMQEQKRFTNYFTAPHNRRQRQNRSSECGFSEPASPLVIDELKSNVTTPADSPASITGKSSKLATRLATITPILEEERGPSWTPRKFPLSETENNKLDPISDSPAPALPLTVDEMDTNLQVTTPYTNTLSDASQRNPALDLAIDKITANSLATPDNFFTDENGVNKNWTVKLLNNSMNSNSAVTTTPLTSHTEKQHRKGIVLKLAKK